MTVSFSDGERDPFSTGGYRFRQWADLRAADARRVFEDVDDYSCIGDTSNATERRGARSGASFTQPTFAHHFVRGALFSRAPQQYNLLRYTTSLPHSSGTTRVGSASTKAISGATVNQDV